MSIPAERERREERLAAITAAKTKIAARAARVAVTGKQLGGTAPKAPTPGPRVDDQSHLTDDASRIMPVASSSATTPKPWSILSAC